MGLFTNDHGDCQVSIVFEASRLLQTDSPADWFQIDIKLDARKMAVSIVIYTLSVNYSIIKILFSYFPNK